MAKRMYRDFSVLLDKPFVEATTEEALLEQSHLFRRHWTDFVKGNQ
jgi:hypothetical protein